VAVGHGALVSGLRSRELRGNGMSTDSVFVAEKISVDGSDDRVAVQAGCTSPTPAGALL
jgi:hypothetical protein